MTLMLLACWVGSPVTGYKSARAVRRRGPAVSAVLSFNSLPDLWHSLCLRMRAQATSQTPPTASLLPTLLIQKSGYTRLPYFINRWGCPEKWLKQFYLNTGSKLTEYGRFWRTSTTGSNSSDCFVMWPWQLGLPLQQWPRGSCCRHSEYFFWPGWAKVQNKVLFSGYFGQILRKISVHVPRCLGT